MDYETENVEFKSIITDDIYKEVIAFANTDGGTIFIGVDRQGKITPLENIDDSYTRITNGIRDAIAPDVTIFVKYTLEDNKIIRVEVGEGSFKPYYLKAKGLKPSGVYIRHGASSVPASPEQIRQMIKNADGDVFEELRSLEQNLTFEFCAKTFKEQGVEFNEEKYGVLGIRNTQGLYTNLALLLSDQCTHTVKVAVFADDQNTIFRDQKEFTGSVFKQMEETFSYLQLVNQNRSVIDGLARTDYWDYPKEALREALINALIHRDYSFSGSVIINANDKGIEFISIGGLLPGLSQEDIRNGISLPRNRRLAEVFHRLKFIESYGSGIRRIYTLYGDSPELPSIVVTPNSFKIVLPNINAAKTTGAVNPVKQIQITPQMQKVLDYLAAHSAITETELQKLLKIKRTRSYTLTKQMIDLGLIRAVKENSVKKYMRV